MFLLSKPVFYYLNSSLFYLAFPETRIVVVKNSGHLLMNDSFDLFEVRLLLRNHLPQSIRFLYLVRIILVDVLVIKDLVVTDFVCDI